MKRIILTTVVCLLASACAGPRPDEAAALVELKHFPIDSLEEVRAVQGVSFDRSVSKDGQGSLRVDAEESLLVPLFEVTDVGLKNATLLYQASLQSERLNGEAWLEMFVRFPGRGEFFSRGMDQPVTGTMSWKTVTIPFFLQEGQEPDLIRLNLMVKGKGRVWIDDVRLLKRPLPGR
ncbi:MAG: hypothetical protein ACE5IP_12545 [Terriglobia bacterium]